MMEITEILSMATIIVANAAAIATIFINLNVKIAENAKDLLSLKNDIEEHKSDNREDIRELKELILRDKVENRDDHKSIIVEIVSMSKGLSDFKMDIIRAIQKNTK